MKKFLISTGFIVSFMATHFVLQAGYIIIPVTIASIKAVMAASANGNEALDAEQVNIVVQEAISFYEPIAIIFSAIISAFIFYFYIQY